MLEDARLPEYKGSAFRGAFAWVFRQTVCVTKQKTCENCILRAQCCYFKFFETELNGDKPAFLKGVRKLPHPFIIHPPLESRRTYHKDDILNVGLTVFGDAINYFPYFVYTFQQMGFNGISEGKKKFALERVSLIGIEGNMTEVFSCQDSSYLINKFAPVTSSEILSKAKVRISSDRMLLRFQTPVRLQKDGKVISGKDNIDVRMIISLLERRAVSLSYFYCGGQIPECNLFIVNENLEIAENKLEFYNWSRFSNRQKREIDMSGFTGELTLSGDIGYFIPLLALGEYIHLGKNTVFGLGKYLIHSVI